MELSQKVPFTQFDVDSKCRVLLADGYTLSKIFACGIGYPVRTKDGMISLAPGKNNPRADSFSLYMNFVGDTILKGVLPKQKFVKNTIHRILPQKKVLSEEAETMKKEYQQIVKARILKYRKGDQLAQIDENAGMRHKSLNVREQYHNNIGRKSNIANIDPAASVGK